MTDPGLQVQIEAANAYESLFVPALFQQWAPQLIAAARIEPGQRVLDVACGTGVLARAAAASVGAAGSVVGLDANPGMLAVAARIAPGVEWRQGTAESLPFPDQSFDAVVSQFGLMFFADRQAAIREMLRVLRPQGRLAVAVWDSLANTPAYADEVAVVERVAGQRAADALRAPFVLGNRAALTALVAGAGAVAVTVDPRAGTGRFPSIRTMVEADLRGWLPVMGVTLTEEQIGRILAEADQALARYRVEGGRAEFASPALIVTATKP